jgi:hypothetical protein
VAGRRAAGLADPDAEAVEGQLGEAGGAAAQGGEARPDHQRDRDDRHPVPALGHAGDRDAQQGVEEGEIEAAQQAQLGVGQLEVDLDGLADGGDDRPVDEVEGVGGEQQPQHRGLVAVRIQRLCPAGRNRVSHPDSPFKHLF